MKKISQIISIHALREEGDSGVAAAEAAYEKFLSTPSARRATSQICSALSMTLYFYPRPPRGGRRLPFRAYAKVWNISIHALREEGDSVLQSIYTNMKNFYPRPPRGGRHDQVAFVHRGKQDFYPRPPRGGRRFFFGKSNVVTSISIHALREEGDRSSSVLTSIKLKFLSTPSARRAT